MTANPVREIFLALVAERLKQIEADAEKKGAPFPKEDSQAIRELVRQICAEFQALTTKRNEVVHAKWFIGFGDEKTDGFKDTGHYKRRLGAAGLGFVKDPPRTAEEIDALTKACDGLAATVQHFTAGFLITGGPKGMSKLFEANGKRWEIKK